MNFSKLRHRVIFLKPSVIKLNGMGESVPCYKPFKPHLNPTLKIKDSDVYLTRNSDGNAVMVSKDGKVYAHKLLLTEYSVAGLVVPMSGREYEESQKIRAETTYKIHTRYFPGITQDMHIFYANREFEIISVLDLNGRQEELQIVATETGRKNAQNYEGDSDG